MDNKHSLTGFVFNRLREDILNGKYKENDELKEMAIAKELNVSRTPVREAIRQLEFEGLVESIPNKATYVIGISIKDVKDIYEMRASLERLCAKKAIDNMTDDIMEKLEEIVDLSMFYNEKGKYDNILELDNRFHELLYEAANSKMLRHTLSDFHHYLQRIRHTTLSGETRAKQAVCEHRDILEAIKSKDTDRAMMLAEQHIINSINNIERLGLWIEEQ
ncbi:MAG: GntR family transcriptional regulator [Lachnospiraceae bacterium]